MKEKDKSISYRNSKNNYPYINKGLGLARVRLFIQLIGKIFRLLTAIINLITNLSTAMELRAPRALLQFDRICYISFYR